MSLRYLIDTSVLSVPIRKLPGAGIVERLTAPFVDGQIAAIAVVNGLTPVTPNAQDFRGSGIEGGGLAGWREAKGERVRGRYRSRTRTLRLG